MPAIPGKYIKKKKEKERISELFEWIPCNPLKKNIYISEQEDKNLLVLNHRQYFDFLRFFNPVQSVFNNLVYIGGGQKQAGTRTRSARPCITGHPGIYKGSHDHKSSRYSNEMIFHIKTDFSTLYQC